MIRKFLVGASLAGLMVLGAATQAIPAQSQSGQESAQAKSVAGKVTAIGTDQKSFSMEVDEGGSKRTMQFVLDGNTQVQGRVGTGTAATVQYQPSQDGKNLALSIAPQSSQ
jgi:hypothetical protein